MVVDGGAVVGAAEVGGVEVLVVVEVVLFEFEDAVDGFVDAGFGNIGFDGLFGECGGGWHEEEVGAGLDGFDVGVGFGVVVGDGSHVEGVGDDEIIVAEFVAEEVGGDFG